ncbi:hypothetical protein B0I37DRAFT_372254 [Chaetomium sp. MPI-CAGE-AT-0009]|nr:hypothetical protein B0I37DRAFT_372254 [Chaetomium sp. MPI-CAGE-AT-0009]
MRSSSFKVPSLLILSREILADVSGQPSPSSFLSLNTNTTASNSTSSPQLLCACGRQCLNPTNDHIGRCEGPCSL